MNAYSRVLVYFRRYVCVAFLSQAWLVPTHAQASGATVDWTAPRLYDSIYRGAFSLLTTSYYAITDSNKASADMRDWKIDTTTKMNIAWRTLYYGCINRVEAYILQNKHLHTENWDRGMNEKLGYLKQFGAMLTYNTRYNETIFQKLDAYEEHWESHLDEDFATYVAIASVFMTNFVWYFTIPMWWAPAFSTLFARTFPHSQYVGGAVFEATQSQLRALVTYTFYDLLLNHALISFKHSISSVFPSPNDLSFFRFADCTACYLGTNLLGRSGFLGSYLYSMRNRVVGALKGAADASELVQSVGVCESGKVCH